MQIYNFLQNFREFFIGKISVTLYNVKSSLLYNTTSDILYNLLYNEMDNRLSVLMKTATDFFI